jgi:LuxR family transcriptional regulator, maltose regulon positive regulatory protein
LAARKDNRLRERVRIAVGAETRPEALVSVFAGELRETKVLLVLDDFHLVSDPDATAFVRLLLERTNLRILIASRQKLPWSTARRVLYGEIFELRSHLLAMDDDEVAAVLGRRRAAHVAQLLSAAEGWPAVIGLAALTASSEELDLHESLYDYFADELMHTVPQALRPHLLTLALLPSLSRQALELLAGSRIVSLAVDLGFVSLDQSHLRAFHPLLRSFLVKRYSEDDPHQLAVAVEAVSDHLIAHAMWDDALTLLDNFPSIDSCLLNLLECGSEKLLRAGRVSTVDRLVAMARKRGLASPGLDLAEAEVAFRKGSHHRAHALATRAAGSPDIDRHDATRSFILAGRSAALADEFERSIECYELAYCTATNSAEKINALWGQLMAANFLERSDTQDILAELIALGYDSDDAILRVAMAHFHSTLWARLNLADCLFHYRSSEHIAEHSADSLMVSAFLQTFAHAHILVGEYEEAAKIALKLDKLVESHYLTFARPAAYGTRGYVEFGLGRYADAAATAYRLEEEATRLGDDHYILNARHIKARILLASGEFDEAMKMCMPPKKGHPARSMVGEILATQGLAYACLYDWPHARASLREARSITRSLEAEGMALWAEAVMATLQDEESSQSAVAAAIRFLQSTSYVDGFVAAARASPRLVAAVLPFADQLIPSATRVFPVSRSEQAAVLSPREREVATLIGAGLTNREIAMRLIISEATVKVHVRHILEKLRARSRAEAVARLLARDVLCGTSTAELNMD